MTHTLLPLAETDDDFYPDDALPTHHLDDGHDGRQRGMCPHSGGPRTDTGGCPRGCGGATEHYSNDGHRSCHEPDPNHPERQAAK